MKCLGLVSALCIIGFTQIPVYAEDSHYVRGWDAMQHAEFQKAKEEFDRALNDPQPPDDVYFQRGLCKLHLKQYQAALSDFSITIAKGGPGAVSAYENRACCYGKQGNWSAAMKDYNSAITLTRTSTQYSNLAANAFAGRAESYFHLGKLKESKADADRAISQDPANAEPYYIRGEALQKLGQQKLAKADFDKAKSLGYDPARLTVYIPKFTQSDLPAEFKNSPEGAAALAMVNAQAKQFKASVRAKELRAAIADAQKTSGNDSATVGKLSLQLAAVQKDNGHCDEASELFQHCQKIFTASGDKQDLAESTFGLGDCYYLLNKLSDAETEFKSALEQQQELKVPNDGKLRDIINAYAKVEYKLNKIDEANSLYEQLKALK